jgi:hypothetical protein
MNAMAIELCRPNRNPNLGRFSGGASVKAVYLAQVAMHSIAELTLLRKMGHTINWDNGRRVLDLQLLLVSACRKLSKKRLNVFPHPNGHGGRVLAACSPSVFCAKW